MDLTVYVYVCVCVGVCVCVCVYVCIYINLFSHTIFFVRAGEKAQQQPRYTGGLLANARDWNLQVDLGRQLKFPNHITANIHAYIYIYIKHIYI